MDGGGGPGGGGPGGGGGGQRQRGMGGGGGQQHFGGDGQAQQPFGAPDLNNPMLHMAASQGAQFFDQGQKMISSNVSQYVSMNLLRHYFAVDTTYVLKKLKIILFPFMHKNWHREKDVGDGGHPYSAPRDCVNAPDLYLPTMAFVTYILVIGYHMGQVSSFTPEVLGKTGSRGLVMLVLEVLALKVGFYLLDGPRNSFLDFTCWSGYKYVGITICCLSRVFLGQAAQMLLLAVTGMSMSWFIFKTVATALILSDARSQASPGNAARQYFVLALAACQIPVCWVMGI